MIQYRWRSSVRCRNFTSSSDYLVLTIMAQKFAFFDADGTLLGIRSMFSFELFYIDAVGGWTQRATAGLVFKVLYRLLLPRYLANRRFYRRYKGRRPSIVQDQVRCWYHTLRESVYIHGAVRELEQLQAQGVQPVMVSGSSVDILRPFADRLGIRHVLATRLEVCAGAYTGRILPPQTIGLGKLEVVRNFLVREGGNPAECYGYGDHESDLPMLEAVGQPRVVAGNPKMELLAQKRSWPIISRI